ncbi:hypothetical protein [Desulfovibrio sp. TomC]|uniref:hypothetical protein n=1 Tax=Desulfovibrio sp. TomC TaxID=1562888 RepID=UPI0005757ADE|nr:hypothetical protein [Desulfovibrio sp. TomC]KHK02073.1 hypothetical protein NY78_2557 [Desulfovibrio sp. TomC]
MSETYPQSLPCRFAGFPARIAVVCGRAFSEARSTPYSFGSRVTLAQTPKSGQTFGELAVGLSLPTTEIIYADTGRDDVFDLKISHYGYGRFYLADAEAAFFTLAVVKGIRVEASGVCRAFETLDLWNTLIPVAKDLSAPPVAPEAVWLQDAADGAAAEDYNRVRVAWFAGSVPPGGRIVSGRLQLGGDLSLQA